MMADGIIRAAGTSGAAAAGVDDDLEEDGMQCNKHPYRNNAASGGICALCLQEKLGKLVSSSFFNVGSSSSSSPSFRSDPSSTANAASLSLTLALRPAVSGAVVSTSSSTNGRHRENQGFCSSTNQISTTKRSRIPFLLIHKKKKSTADQHPNNLVLKRSKSAVAPRRRPSAGEDYSNGVTHKRGGFWSFLYHSKPKPEKPSSSTSSSARDLKPAVHATSAPPPLPPPVVQLPPSKNVDTPASSSSKRAEYVVVVDENLDSPSSGSSNATSFGRKVSRSRSVGCGSRSFSGDFFERISTGFGDCTLRRVESQREGKRRSSGDVIKEKVRCGGIFRGFMMTSSSSSSSSSYRLSAVEENHVNGKGPPPLPAVVQGRSKSWRWALASPMRAFGKSSPSSSAKELKSATSKSNATPNMAAIPSLLSVR